MNINILGELMWRWPYLFKTIESKLCSPEPKVQHKLAHKDSYGLTTLKSKTLCIFHVAGNSFQECIHISIFLNELPAYVLILKTKLCNYEYWLLYQDAVQQCPRGILGNMKLFLLALNNSILQCLSESYVCFLIFSSFSSLLCCIHL